MAITKINGGQIKDLVLVNTHVAANAAIATSKLADGSNFIMKGGTVAFTANQSMGSNKLTNLSNGTTANDAINLSQLQNALSGLDFQPDVLNVQANDTLDPGATPATGARYLIKNASALNANFGTITGIGNNDIVEYDGTAFVVKYDVSVKGSGALVWDGTANVWMRYDGTNWDQFGGLSSATAGDGLTMSGNIINFIGGNGLTVGPDLVTVNLDGSGGLEFNSGAVRLKAGVAGAGLGHSGGVLSVNVDGSTVEISTDTLQVKDAGITSAKLASGVAGDGLTGGAGSALAVGAGDGIDVAADSVAVDVTDFIDTTKGLKETSNDIQINLESDGGIAFDGTNHGLELKPDATTGATIAPLTVGANGAGVTVDNSTIVHTTGTIAVKAGSIGTTQLTNPGNGKIIYGVSGAATAVVYVVRETPTGDVDGTNAAFVLAATPQSGTETVFLNGILQDPGSSDDYTIATATITFNTAPPAESTIKVNYLA